MSLTLFSLHVHLELYKRIGSRLNKHIFHKVYIFIALQYFFITCDKIKISIHCRYYKFRSKINLFLIKIIFVSLLPSRPSVTDSLYSFSDSESAIFHGDTTDTDSIRWILLGDCEFSETCTYL